jgi:predicted  nucleic acid-binding Zn-ribbon protein
LKALVDNKPNLVKTLIEHQKTIKTLKIQLGSSEQRITQSLKKLKAVSEKNEALNSELSELKIQLADRDEYIKNMEENLSAETVMLTAEAKQYQEKTSKTEDILKQLMLLYDYEID